jgi:hypothetical protein
VLSEDLRSQLIKKPRGAGTLGAGSLDAGPKHPVRGDDGYATSVTDVDLRDDSLDDRVITRPRRVDGAQRPVLPGRVALPRLALQNQEDLVIRQHSVQQPILQPTGSPRAITPPTVGATTHNVRAIDDQDLHSDSVSESLNATRAESMWRQGACTRGPASGMSNSIWSWVSAY